MKQRSRLVDVAQLAGVSLATASKALNGREQVAERTRQRVEAAADQLSFEGNMAARSLSTGRMGAVGLLTSDLEGRFSLPILLGAEDAFGSEGTAVLLSDARGDRVRESRHLKTLTPRIDALMVVGSRTDPRPSISAETSVPVIYVYTPSDSMDDCSLTPDNVEGGRLAIRHLQMTGRSRILHITGPENDCAATDRRVGIDEAIAASNGAISLVSRTSYGEWSERWGRAAMLLARREVDDFDAVVCDSDQIARGALDALVSEGVQVPSEVAIIGFDNWKLINSDTWPPITSVDMGLEAMGSQAARLLAEAISGVPFPRGRILTPCALVARGSTLMNR